MAQKNLKPHSLHTPSPIEISRPPPYDPERALPSEDEWSARPQNYICISRTFGALTGTRFTIDPNLKVPKSLLTPPEWNTYVSSWEKPKPNIDLTVQFGTINTQISVLSLSGDASRCINGQCIDKSSSRTSYLYTDSSNTRCPRQTALEVTTTSGNITLRLDAPSTAPIYARASSTFGQICVFLPRTFQGPFTITTSLGAPHLSPELMRVCAPLREVGSGKRWFVGDFSAWQARGQHADEAVIGTTWGGVWVGYEGEEKEAKAALRWGALQWGAHITLALLVAILLRLVVKLLLWVVKLLLWVILGIFF
ncbi:hypothetical protein B0H11DRAFT_55097 [Mycena galericulata]|nr:hypothetical protein B0H11DRAFT_55097 [Mycena galericulata]